MSKNLRPVQFFKARLIASFVFYAVFFSMGFYVAFVEVPQIYKNILIVLLLLAFFTVPRRELSATPLDDNAEEVQAKYPSQDVGQGPWLWATRQLVNLRVIYFLGAVLVLVVIPHLLG